MNGSKKKTGVISPKRFVQRLKRDNELFRGHQHQVQGPGGGGWAWGWAAGALRIRQVWPCEWEVEASVPGDVRYRAEA